MKKILQYFYFSRKERFGTLLLLLVCTGLFVYPWWRESKREPRSADFTSFEAAIQAYRQSEKPVQTPQAARRLFAFDPNTASATELEQLGLSEKVARNICRYREKGGRFKKPDDLKKIWGLAEADYDRLRPFIRLAEAGDQERVVEPPAPKQTEHQAYSFRKPAAIDLNTADETELATLPLIGPGRAQQIIRFREQLGGFLRVEQLKELYRLPDSVYQLVLPMVRAGAGEIRKINLNTATAAELETHPYISKKQAALIIAYRNQHGPFESASALRQIRAFNDPAWFDKIMPYLSIGPSSSSK